MANKIELLAAYVTRAEHRTLFQAGVLAPAWARAYPMLFDEHDLRLARNQPKSLYYEWLAAILLFHTRGYLSIQKYEFPHASHEKSVTLRKLLGEDVKLALQAYGQAYRSVPRSVVVSSRRGEWGRS